MVELIGLAGLGAFVVASIVVGGRVVLLSMRTRQLPELAIGLSLLLSGGIGTGLVVYAGVVRESADPLLMYQVIEAGNAINHVGYVLLFYFVWRVFRPGVTWAACLFAVSTLVLMVGGVGTALTLEQGGGFPGRTTPGDLWFWLSLGTQFVVYAWASIESFHYYGMLRRRLALGLADGSVVNRFFYWGVCTSAVCCIWINLGVSALMTESEEVQSYSLVISALLGFVVAGGLSLAFFPRKKRVSNLGANELGGEEMSS